jgi:predicted secreted Zn-dependent protease
MGVTVESHIIYYDVTAATLAEIRRGIYQGGPRSQGRTWGAVTRWRLTWTSQSTSVGLNSCELRRVRVRVQTNMTFPRWNPTAEPDSALLEWWQQFNTGLAEHERGHALLAVRGAGEVARSLEGLHTMCSTLNGQANTLFREHVLAINKKQEDYDFTTRHGATQIQAVRRLAEPD